MGIFNKNKQVIDYIDGYNDIPDYLGCCPDCPCCGEAMGYSYGKSEFKCFSCGCILDENDLEIDDYTDDIPWSCKNCGGPYPLCTTSCKMFDD